MRPKPVTQFDAANGLKIFCKTRDFQAVGSLSQGEPDALTEELTAIESCSFHRHSHYDAFGVGIERRLELSLSLIWIVKDRDEGLPVKSYALHLAVIETTKSRDPLGLERLLLAACVRSDGICGE